jgi:hypothetical protein
MERLRNVRRILQYQGGAPAYRERRRDEVAADRYAGMAVAGPKGHCLLVRHKAEVDSLASAREFMLLLVRTSPAAGSGRPWRERGGTGVVVIECRRGRRWP